MRREGEIIVTLIALFIAGIVIGTIVVMFGGGGAAIYLGNLTGLVGLPSINAAAASAYVLACMSVLGTIFHIGSGTVDWSLAISLMVGAMLGALIAPHLLTIVMNSKIGKYFQPAMAILLVILEIKTLI